MKLRQLFSDDDAVSPVIGVILMVAITVILAAVIASFVLGLGNQSNVSPQASFDAEYSSGAWASYDGNLTLTHDSGDAIISSELYLRGSGFNESGATDNTWENYNATKAGATYEVTVSGTSSSQPAVVAGDRLKVGAQSDYEMRAVWESSEGDSSNTLISDEGPDA